MAWLALPGGTPQTIVARYNAVAGNVVNAPETKQLFLKQGIEPQSSAPGEFAVRIRHELADNRTLVKRSGATTE
ncbi:MAG: hypothetical protein ACXWCH_34210 [Burkholderiales bacterium]